jgi:cytochrome P450
MVFLDLLQAGTDMTSTFLETLMLHMNFNPDVQDGVRREIQSVIIPNGEPSQDEIQRMPYTQATLLESLRIGEVSVNLAHRRVLKDIHYKGYLVPKV